MKRLLNRTHTLTTLILLVALTAGAGGCVRVYDDGPTHMGYGPSVEVVEVDPNALVAGAIGLAIIADAIWGHHHHRCR